MFELQLCQPNCLIAKFGGNRELGRSPVIAFIKEQIESPLNRGKARREVGWSLRIDQPLRFGQNFLGPGDTFLNCRVGGYKSAGNLVDTKPAQDVQDKHDLRLCRQTRMATGEHHAELVVFDCGVGKHFFYDGSECPLALEKST
jgi:hypothetical protein